MATGNGKLDSRRPIWITWERQVRNRSLSKAFNAKLYELDMPGGRLRRYTLLSLKTISIFFRRESEIVFVQNPSLVLALLANIICRILGTTVVVDSHNGGLFPMEGRSLLLNTIAKFIVRVSAYTIVSNSALADHVRSIKGRPLVLPDPLPDVGDGNPAPLGRKSVLFICTWAGDEPYQEVLKAASQIDADIYITGRAPQDIVEVQSELAANIVLTGFLEEQAYNDLLRQVDVIVDLTTRENCLVCGAYEAVSAGTPMVLSDTRALKTYFYKGAIYTPNDASEIVKSINDALEKKAVLAGEIKELKDELEQSWSGCFNSLKEELQLFN